MAGDGEVLPISDYHQCVPAATTSQETLVTSTTTPTSPSISTTASATSTAGATCTGDFASISAADFIDKLNPGWNLGNTLDAIPDEGSWNNEPVVGSTFDMVKAAGFTGVRLPGLSLAIAFHIDAYGS